MDKELYISLELARLFGWKWKADSWLKQNTIILSSYLRWQTTTIQIAASNTPPTLPKTIAYMASTPSLSESPSLLLASVVDIFWLPVVASSNIDVDWSVVWEKVVSTDSLSVIAVTGNVDLPPDGASVDEFTETIPLPSVAWTNDICEKTHSPKYAKVVCKEKEIGNYVICRNKTACGILTLTIKTVLWQYIHHSKTY